MRLSRRPKPFDSDDYIFELKIDGFLALAYTEDGSCDLVSRNGNTFHNFKDLAQWIGRICALRMLSSTARSPVSMTRAVRCSTIYCSADGNAKHLITALDEFQFLGVDFISLGESIDTSTSVGKMIFTVLGAVAELERNIIRERVTMGLSRARNEGKTLGRPKVVVDRETVRELYKAGNSVRRIATEMGLTKSTVHSIVTRH